VYYHLAAGTGKDPVAYTDFAERNRWVDGRLVPGRPWVSASYLAGGFDNLTELLHETGHAIHIAGIRTRPAFVDWPDDDTFTEALADVAAAEAFEPFWQITFLGDSIPLARALRAKYAWTAMDMAWALFEIRIHREPGADPNAVWTAITSEYLRIRPHPEWSWWAMRGQLIDSPGYLVNYAIGAFVTADIRHRIQQLKGPMMDADSTLYPWLVAQLYQFGGERPSARVLEDFLGRRLSAMALLADLDRIGS
jgi:oligoendopeptidase F